MIRTLKVAAVLGTAYIALLACPSGAGSKAFEPTSSAGATKASVSTGTNVKAALVPDASTGTKSVSVTFGNVSSGGDVSVTTSASGPTLPTGFVLSGGGAFYDISTSAKFDKATVCFENAAVKANSKLYHYLNNAWKDETSSVTPPTICGDFSSFSPVAIVDGIATPTPTRSATPLPSATATPSPSVAASPSPSASATAAPTATVAPTDTPTQAPTTAPTATPTPTVAPTTAPPTPTVAANPWAGYIFAANASGPVLSGFARYGATIVDASTGAPVVNACVYTGPPSGCPLKGAFHTDANGVFAADLIATSSWAFTIQSDPNNAAYNALVQISISGTSSTVKMTHK